MKFNHLVLVIALMSSTTLIAQGAVEKKKLETINELFKLQKTDKIGEQVLEQMSKNAAQQTPPDQQKKLEETFKKEAHPKEVTESLIPVYDKNFSQAELDDIIKFYNTPTGKKFIEVQPKLIGESSDVIQAWAEKVSNKVRTIMEKKKK